MPTTYTIIDGVHPDDVPDDIQAHWYVGRTGLDRNRRLQGACVAHLNAWRANLYVGNNGTIALEDDCVVYRPRPCCSAKYQSNLITLLGGWFRGFGKWGVCEQTSFMSSGKFIDVVSQLKTGVHELPQKPGPMR